MEIYDQNVIKAGMKPEIRSVEDAEIIHETMVKLEFKLSIGGPYDMPHYRGEQKHGWELLPNIFRIPAVAGDKRKAKQLVKLGWKEFDKVIRSNFGNDALRTIFDNEKYGKDWDLLMQAQHAGVKTSLIDWSPNVYAPLYFATEESRVLDIENADGQFWVYMVPYAKIKSHNRIPVKDTFYDVDPFDLKTGYLINVSILLDDLTKRKYETRMFHQKGRFYISGGDFCDIPMNNQAEIAPLLFRFRIPAKYKSAIRSELQSRGIDCTYLFGHVNPAHQSLIDNINKKIFNY